MAEAKPVQPFADRTAMHAHSVHHRQLSHDLVQRQVALHRQPVPQPASVGGQLALCVIALSQRGKAAAVTLQDHHVVHEPRRNPEVPRSLPMPMTFLNKRDHAAAQLYRM